MKAEHINPFVESTTEVFATMLHCTPKRGQMRLGTDSEGSFCISAIIGLTGTAKGSVEMSFPDATALAVSNRLVGEEHTEVNDNVIDALSEMVNMVSGSAKAKFAGHRINISLPTVVRGKDHQVNHPKGTKSLVVPFESELGEFIVRVSFETIG
ncbi:MAG: chemotaxis protein CheX [Planctomycetota bacterium]